VGGSGERRFGVPDRPGTAGLGSRCSLWGFAKQGDCLCGWVVQLEWLAGRDGASV